MKYFEAIKQFNTDDTVVILLETDEGLKVVSDYNFVGGVCGCCMGLDANDNLEVVRVVDVETMEVFYDRGEG